jgi:hypothetical protein
MINMINVAEELQKNFDEWLLVVRAELNEAGFTMSQDHEKRAVTLWFEGLTPEAAADALQYP